MDKQDTSGIPASDARPVLEGEPIVIVQDGNVIERNLRRERLTEAEIAEEARCSGIAHLAQVRWAVLETNPYPAPPMP